MAYYGFGFDKVRAELEARAEKRRECLRGLEEASEGIGVWAEVARRLGLPLKEVAELAGVSVSTVRRLRRPEPPRRAGWYPSPIEGLEQRWTGWKWVDQFRDPPGPEPDPDPAGPPRPGPAVRRSEREGWDR